MDSVGRIFVAIGLPPEVRVHVAEVAGEVGMPGRLVAAADLHLTLRFLGEVGPVAFDRLLMELDSQDWPAPFSLRMSGFGAFPKPSAATVAWVGVNANGALDELQDGTEDACVAAGLGREERPFRPHITVARIRPPRDLRPVLAGSEPIDAGFSVNQITVLRSHPGGRIPRYEPLEVFALPR